MYLSSLQTSWNQIHSFGEEERVGGSELLEKQLRLLLLSPESASDEKIFVVDHLLTRPVHMLKGFNPGNTTFKKIPYLVAFPYSVKLM